jgi:predicted membrane protein
MSTASILAVWAVCGSMLGCGMSTASMLVRGMSTASILAVWAVCGSMLGCGMSTASMLVRGLSVALCWAVGCPLPLYWLCGCLPVYLSTCLPVYTVCARPP